MSKTLLNKYVGDGKKLVKISSTPNTWIEVDDNLTDDQIAEKVKKLKQLTNMN